MREKLAATILLFSALLCFAGSDKNISADNATLSIHVNNSLRDYNHYLNTNRPELLAITVLDTVPKKKKEKITIEKDDGQKEIKIKIEDGEVKEMIVDGKRIEESEYGEYEDLYKNYKGDGNIWIWDEEGGKMFKGFSEDDWKEWGEKWENWAEEWKENWDEEEAEKWEKWGEEWGKKWNDEEWSEYWEEQGKKWEEWADKWEKEWDSEEFKKQWEENWDEGKWEEFWEKNWDSQKFAEQYKDMAQKLSEKMRDFNFEFDFKDLPEIELGELPEFDYDFSFGPKAGDVMISEMWKDGLLQEGKENMIELSGKHLKINGEKQPENIWRKYKELYEGKMGHELSEGSTIEYKIAGEKPDKNRKMKRI